MGKKRRKIESLLRKEFKTGKIRYVRKPVTDVMKI